jgi:hypothetical protein
LETPLFFRPTESQQQQQHPAKEEEEDDEDITQSDSARDPTSGKENEMDPSQLLRRAWGGGKRNENGKKEKRSVGIC